MSLLGFPLPAPVPSTAPCPPASRGWRSRLRFASATVALLASLTWGQDARAVEPSGPTLAQLETQREPSPKVRARLLVAKGAVLGGVLGIAVQIGLAIGLAPAGGPATDRARRPASSPRTTASRVAPLASTSDAPERPTRRSSSAAAEDSERQRPRGRKRRPGSRHTILPKSGTPINISINTYPYYPTGAQPMPWQLPAEGFRHGIQISPSELAAPTGEPPRPVVNPAASVHPPADLRTAPAAPLVTAPHFTAPVTSAPACAVPQQRVPVGLGTDADSAVWKQGFERVHRPKPDQSNARDSKAVSSVEGMMQKIIAENLSLRG